MTGTQPQLCTNPKPNSHLQCYRKCVSTQTRPLSWSSKYPLHLWLMVKSLLFWDHALAPLQLLQGDIGWRQVDVCPLTHNHFTFSAFLTHHSQPCQLPLCGNGSYFFFVKVLKISDQRIFPKLLVASPWPWDEALTEAQSDFYLLLLCLEHFQAWRASVDYQLHKLLSEFLGLSHLAQHMNQQPKICKQIGLQMNFIYAL